MPSVPSTLLTLEQGATKRMEIMWAFHLQKLFDEEKVPITIISLHPGMIGTGTPLRISLRAPHSADTMMAQVEYRKIHPCSRTGS